MTINKKEMETLLSYLNHEDADVSNIRIKLEAELAKEEQRKADKTSAYDTAWEAVRELLSKSNKPLSAAEITEQAELPEGFGKGKVVYGLGHDWADRVVKIEGKVNEYKLKS